MSENASLDRSALTRVDFARREGVNASNARARGAFHLVMPALSVRPLHVLFGSLTLIAAWTHLSFDQSYEADAISTVMSLVWLHPNALLLFRARKPLSARTVECTPSVSVQSHTCACAGI
jgi:hypothetical protein